MNKGSVNIYGNTAPGNLQRDHWLFWSFCWTGPPVILRVGSTGPRLISVKDFNGDYFEVLRYRVMDYFQFFQSFSDKKYGTRANLYYGIKIYFERSFSTGPWKIFDQADTGQYTILYGKINGATVNFTTGHRSFPGYSQNAVHHLPFSLF